MEKGAGSTDSEGKVASMVLEHEATELERRIRALRRKRRRHLLWTILGISPAAIIPAVGLLLEGSIGLVALLALLVTVTQGYFYAKAGREAKGLEEQLWLLRAGDEVPVPRLPDNETGRPLE